MFLTTGILRAGGGIFNFQNGNSRWPCFGDYDTVINLFS